MINPRSPNTEIMKLLRHIDRFRLTTVDIGWQLFEGSTREALMKRLSRYVYQGLLHRYTLQHPVRYYVLGEHGASLLGLGPRRAASLGPQSLPTDYALLLYCRRGTDRRVRLKRSELATACTWLDESLLAQPHCRPEGERVLELVRVDLGGEAQHVARKCKRDIARRTDSPEFIQVISGGHFRLVIISSTEEKSQAIRQAMEAHAWPRGLQVRFSVIPELLFFNTKKVSHA